MDGSPSKRVFTENTLDSRNGVDVSTRNDGVTDELRALLRNRAARVRKSVMEGYSVDRTAPQNTHPDASDAVAEPAQIFQSSRDINHRVLGNWIPSPFSSPKKRTRCDYEAECALEEEDEGEDMEIDPGEPNLQQSLAENQSQRPIKPLRRTLFASKSPNPQDQAPYTPHDGSQSENPFLE